MKHVSTRIFHHPQQSQHLGKQQDQLQAETVGQRTSRYPIAADGSLGARETVAEYPSGTFPDGFTLTSYDPTGPEGVADQLNWRYDWTVPDMLEVTSDGGATTELIPADGQSLILLGFYVDGLPQASGILTFSFEQDALSISKIKDWPSASISSLVAPPSEVRAAGTVAAEKPCDFEMMSWTELTSASVRSSAWLPLK